MDMLTILLSITTAHIKFSGGGEKNPPTKVQIYIIFVPVCILHVTVPFCNNDNPNPTFQKTYHHHQIQSHDSIKKYPSFAIFVRAKLCFA